MRCYKCRGRGLETVDVPQHVDVGGHRFTGKVAGRKCTRCGEVLLDGPAVERFELLAAARMAKAGAANGEAFKFMRKAVGLRGADLASLLDVAAETVSRWETGSLPVERRALALLAAIVAEAAVGETETLDRLRALQVPTKLPRVVRLPTRAAS
jgi:putative zinc finger/helix-turn-helix YgiT family protein